MPGINWDRAFALEQAADDEDLLAELVDLFHTSSADDFVQINNSLSELDPEGAGDAAHSIKGAAASLGIEGIRQVAAAIERAGRAGDIDKALSFVADLGLLLEEFKKTA